MKTKIISIFLIACIFASSMLSCNQTSQANNEGLHFVSQEDQEVSKLPLNNQNATVEQNPEDNIMSETLYLSFSDYSDFLLFGTKGEIDSNKYVNADIVLKYYKFDFDNFVDVKSLFNFPVSSLHPAGLASLKI